MTRRRGAALLVIGAAALMVGTAVPPLADVTLVAPRLLFGLVLVATTGCLVGATYVLVLAFRHGLAELGLLGALLWCTSILPLAHGLTVPGVLAGPNTATMASVFLALPLGLLAAAPLLAPDAAVARAVLRSWRPWVSAWVALVTILATAIVAVPTTWPAPSPTSPVVLLVVAASMAATLRLAARHLRLHRLGGHPASLAAALGFAYLGLSMLVFLTATPFGLGVWSAHLVDIAGAYAATIGLALSGRRNRSTARLLAPVVNRDPLAAFELGLVPAVHAYLALLESKDGLTRDHVVRVGELAMRLGVRAGLPPARLRVLGLGALLHDIGKLAVPDEILKKPGALTHEEFRIIQRHTEVGADIMASSPLLAPAAHLVRWHHERPDGRGYPDGLDDAAIGVDVSIVSAVDAFDAMTQARPYRGPMSVEAALEVLRREAGAQFDPSVVALLERELLERGPVPFGTFDDVGRSLAPLDVDHPAPVLEPVA